MADSNIHVFSDTVDPVKMPDGAKIDCLGMEWIIHGPNDTLEACHYSEGKCLGKNDTAPILTPILIDNDGKPYTRNPDGSPTPGLEEINPEGMKWPEFCDSTGNPTTPVTPLVPPCNLNDPKNCTVPPICLEKNATCGEKYNASCANYTSPHVFTSCPEGPGPGGPGLDKNNTFEFTGAFQVSCR
jgi:hypothetical protein